jgi:hypothetical protein
MRKREGGVLIRLCMIALRRAKVGGKTDEERTRKGEERRRHSHFSSILFLPLFASELRREVITECRTREKERKRDKKRERKKERHWGKAVPFSLSLSVCL